tara:strand:+ start:1068 stop:1964 length:897 start_codon:yes stop_codon:yes gene_type:complete
MELRTQALFVIPVCGLAGALIAWIGSTAVTGTTAFSIAIAVAFAVNWLMFIPSYVHQTERYFDLTGSITFLTATWLSLLVAGNLGDPRALLLAIMISIWALRLGSFLFNRVVREGHDGRFETILPEPRVLLMTWTLQALWVTINASAAIAVLSAGAQVPLGIWAVIGGLMWFTGFAIEVTADTQKSHFRADPANKGRFITTGLWAWSRHPNYFGELLLWAGVAVAAAPVLSGWQYLFLGAPLLTLFLMTKVSGVDMLERRADKRWGADPEYQNYKSSTPSLVLRPPRANRNPNGATAA